MTILYLGLDPSRYERKVVHFPIIEIMLSPSREIERAFAALPEYNTVILTSRTACTWFMHFGSRFDTLKEKNYVVVGKATAHCLRDYGLVADYVAKKEQAEGVVEILKGLAPDKHSFFYPHSKKAREVILQFLQKRSHLAFPFYEPVVTKKQPPDLALFTEIVFTSPSTVNAFLQIYGKIPGDKICTAIGPITARFLSA
ncbi:MAG: uroporphyrinogen-III synthase [Chlamydiales bacterium]